jgi:hypothetical protein
MNRTAVAAFVVGFVAGFPALGLGADCLQLQPGTIELDGPQASQRVLVLRSADGRVVGDATTAARFSSSDVGVAAVDPQGNVRAVGDGSATIRAVVGSTLAEAKVEVRGTHRVFTPSFRNQVLPLLTRIGCNSGACHGALAGKGGLKLSLRGYDPAADHFVLTRQALGRRIDRSDPARSLFLLKPTRTVPHGGGLKLELGSPDYHLIADWIAAGAPGPSESDPRIARLEVLPSAAMLRPKDTLQMIVRARYSDGHSADVTRWAKFNSSEDLVAGVLPDGRATVAGHGEAAITVWYSNLVAAATITSPYANTLGREVFTAAAHHNFIDDHVLRKLETLALPPSPLCSEREFIRRAYLDAAGILPTPDEVHRFLADTAWDKRARLIDALLARPEFVDYWAYKWSDVLLITTRPAAAAGRVVLLPVCPPVHRRQ